MGGGLMLDLHPAGPAPTYFDRAYFNSQVPREGPRCCKIDVPFTVDDHEFDIDFLLTQAQNFMSLIMSVFVDNSQNASPVTLLSSILLQSLSVPANAQAYLPLLAPKNVRVSVASPGAVTVPMRFFNVPLPASVWSV
jgi:hypothetical protein